MQRRKANLGNVRKAKKHFLMILASYTLISTRSPKPNCPAKFVLKPQFAQRPGFDAALNAAALLIEGLSTDNLDYGVQQGC